MELRKVQNRPVSLVVEFIPQKETSDIHFIAAHTVLVSIEELQNKHTIPVFAKDNESTIIHL